MDFVYDKGAWFIQFLQCKLGHHLWYFELINCISNPSSMLKIVMPFISIFDSVFAAEMTCCIAFGNWSNAVMKWWLLEDRPYWWVEMTDYYRNCHRPVLLQNIQTCETGPGCPSGHCMSMAIFLSLTLLWWANIMNDFGSDNTTWKWIWYPLCATIMISVMLARMITGTHFPHQVLLGTLLGAIISQYICVRVIEPFIYQKGAFKGIPQLRVISKHVFVTFVTMGISTLTYYSIRYWGTDPNWTEKLAREWCCDPCLVLSAATPAPIHTFANSNGHLFGWAVSVTPAITRYRYYTQHRQLIIPIVANILLYYSIKRIQKKIYRKYKNCYKMYNICVFLVAVLKVVLILRTIPYLATYKFRKCDIRNENNPSRQWRFID